MAYTLSDLAGLLGGALELAPGASPDQELIDVQGIDEAGPEHLSFVSNRRYVRALATTRAGAVLLDPATAAPGCTVIRMADPYAAFARALALFHPSPPIEPGVHPRAVVEEGAVVEGAEVRALAWVGRGAVVGAGTVVEAFASIGRRARVGRDCRIMSHAVICEGCIVGDRVVLNPGSVVGGEGFGFAPTGQGHIKIPQTGRAVIEDDVELGSNTCVDRAAMAETLVRRGAKLDNLVQVGHGAEVGEHDLLVAFSGVAGSSRLGRFVTLAAQSGVLGHLKVGDRVVVGSRGLVTTDLPDGAHVSGAPAFDHGLWKRATVAFKELPDMLRRLRRLEAKVDGGEGSASGTTTTPLPDAAD